MQLLGCSAVAASWMCLPSCCALQLRFSCLPTAPRQPSLPPLPHLPTRPLQDLALSLRLLDEAAQRLQDAIEFLRGSDEPLVALGDVLLERGETLAGSGDVAGAAAALRRALSDGYQVRVLAWCLCDCRGEQVLVGGGQCEGCHAGTLMQQNKHPCPTTHNTRPPNASLPATLKRPLAWAMCMSSWHAWHQRHKTQTQLRGTGRWQRRPFVPPCRSPPHLT